MLAQIILQGMLVGDQPSKSRFFSKLNNNEAMRFQLYARIRIQ